MPGGTPATTGAEAKHHKAMPSDVPTGRSAGTRCQRPAWTGSWNVMSENPSATSAIRAVTGVLGAASAPGARGRPSCKRQASGSNLLTGSQFSGSPAFASTLIVEHRRVVTSCCRSTSLP